MYKVIHEFLDLQDNNHYYGIGDSFPRRGMTVSKDRFVELSGSENKIGKPLIEEVRKPRKQRKGNKHVD